MLQPTKVKNIKQTKNYKNSLRNNLELQGRPSAPPEQWRRVSYTRQLVATRGFTRRRKKNQGTGGSGTTSSPLHLTVGVDLQNTKKHNKQVCFSPDLFLDFSLL